MNENWLIERLLLLIPLWLSLSVHEWGHAWAAWRLGDDTAALAGRLTLNPFAHIDLVGTVLLPLLGVPFGWARPVPVQPQNFHPGVSMRTGMMLTAIAGPLTNVCLAAMSLVGLVTLLRFQPVPSEALLGICRLLMSLIFLNVILATFNLLPIPPLDGSRVADALMPTPLRPLWEGLCRLGPMMLMAVIFLPSLMGVSLMQGPLLATQYVVQHCLTLVGG